jgi:hypothetical protein
MSDLVNRLRSRAQEAHDQIDAAGYGNVAASTELIDRLKSWEAMFMEAADEIEKLRSLIGSLSPNGSFREIVKQHNLRPEEMKVTTERSGWKS